MHQLSLDSFGHGCVRGNVCAADRILYKISAGVDRGSRTGRPANHRGAQAGEHRTEDAPHEPEKQERQEHLQE